MITMTKLIPAIAPVFVKKSEKEYPKEVPMMIFGGSPHMVADPPRFAQKISDKIIGIGSNFKSCGKFYRNCCKE